MATDPWVMPQLLPEPVAAALQRRLEALGVTFHLGCGIRELAASENALLALLDDGSEVHADQGLSAIGLAPRTDLAAGAGLSVGRGVRVDAQLRSSDPHIYALAGFAEVAGLNLMYVMPLMTSARALAKTLAAVSIGLMGGFATMLATRTGNQRYFSCKVVHGLLLVV